VTDRDQDAFQTLDYLYIPTADIDAGIRFYTSVLGAKLRWRIRQGTTWVAALRITDTAPTLLLANHLEPGRLILIYRVKSLDAVQRALAGGGWSAEGDVFELPVGPCIVFRDPTNQRLAAYERRRPGVEASFEGRFDTH
jgi:predicted enzyme related to lactoylglutathione lyase